MKGWFNVLYGGNMIKFIYIVITNAPMNDFRYHIDSVWNSERKAKKRCDELNSDENEEWRDEYGYGLFEVTQEFISK